MQEFLQQFLQSGDAQFDNPLLYVAILLWVLPWKGIALWKAARNEHKGWFIALLIINTFALLEVLYIFYFSKWKKKEKEKL
jgi:hypothetical protein